MAFTSHFIYLFIVTAKASLIERLLSEMREKSPFCSSFMILAVCAIVYLLDRHALLLSDRQKQFVMEYLRADSDRQLVTNAIERE